MRLEVTRKCDLAMKALRELSQSQDRIKGPELAEKVGSTSGFLSQALNPLVRAGYVKSEPGPTGGYSLGLSLDQISVLAVIEAIEGPTASGECILSDGPCDQVGNCALHLAWSKARVQLLKELGSTTVSESVSSR